MTSESSSMFAIKLKQGKAGPSMGRHPWIYAKAIEETKTHPEDGSEVLVFGDKGQLIGRGLYHSKSQIRVRLYAFEDRALDGDFWRGQIRRAIELRRSLLGLNAPASGERLIFSEADELSGLTVDRFANTLVVQISSYSLWLRRDLLLSILKEETACEHLLLRSPKNVEKWEGFTQADEWVGAPLQKELLVREKDLIFKVQLEGAQKTGFYFDQRENRLRLREMVERSSLSGGSALDLCSYTGAFALHLAKAGMKEVTGVDTSEAAIALATENAKRNELPNAHFVEADLFNYLREEKKTFEVVVLDPPKLVPSSAKKHEGLRLYFKMNEVALARVKPGGLFVSCSCSGALSTEDLASLIQGVARRARRSLQFLEVRGASPDHPISAACAETQYLKSFVCKVD